MHNKTKEKCALKLLFSVAIKVFAQFRVMFITRNLIAHRKRLQQSRMCKVIRTVLFNPLLPKN